MDSDGNLICGETRSNSFTQLGVSSGIFFASHSSSTSSTSYIAVGGNARASIIDLRSGGFKTQELFREDDAWRDDVVLAIEYVPNLNAAINSFGGRPLLVVDRERRQYLEMPNPHNLYTSAIAFMPRSGLIVTAGTDGRLSVWDRDFTRVLVRELVKVNDQSIIKLAATSDDKLLVGCGTAFFVFDLNLERIAESLEGRISKRKE